MKSLRSFERRLEKVEARMKAKHGGDRGNQYTVEVASGQPGHLAEPKTVEVVAEEVASLEEVLNRSEPCGFCLKIMQREKSR